MNERMTVSGSNWSVEIEASSPSGFVLRLYLEQRKAAAYPEVQLATKSILSIPAQQRPVTSYASPPSH
jgi:hypothetical protein